MLELHSSVRFAHLFKTVGDGAKKPTLGASGRVLLVAHNLVYWFFLIPFFTSVSYATGFAIYAGILFIRFLANTWMNVRDFTWVQYYLYPLRIP